MSIRDRDAEMYPTNKPDRNVTTRAVTDRHILLAAGDALALVGDDVLAQAEHSLIGGSLWDYELGRLRAALAAWREATDGR